MDKVVTVTVVEIVDILRNHQHVPAELMNMLADRIEIGGINGAPVGYVLKEITIHIGALKIGKDFVDIRVASLIDGEVVEYSDHMLGTGNCIASSFIAAEQTINILESRNDKGH